MALSQERKSKIESITADLLSDAYNQDVEIVPPVKLSKILEKYGYSVKSGDFPNETISGALNIEKKIIYVADNDTFGRQMFTIAHELGHIFLNDKKDKEIYYRIDSVNLDESEKNGEIEANYFAASLLMPQLLVKKFWDITKDIEKMALWFGVTRSACYWRLKNLDLISATESN